MMTDEALLHAFREGDRSALGELARRYERPLLGLAVGLLDGRTDMAADAIQETWVRVIRFAAKVDGRSSLKTWLYRIAINQCRTIKSRSRSTRQTSIEEGHTANTASPSTDASAPDDLAWLRGQVSRLSPDKRTVVLLCYHDGMSHQQASEVLEVPVGTLKSRLHAALTTLRAAMTAEASR